MELEFYGGNCFRIKTKQTTIIIDDNLSQMGKKPITNDKSVAIVTSDAVRDENALAQARLVLDMAGEYEVGDVTVNAVQARAHMDEEGAQTATVFQFMHNNQTITIMGHIHPDIDDNVIEMVSGTDVLVIPVGGNGFTLDPVGATSIIKKTEPGLIIPAQYEIKGLNYAVPAQPLEEFAKVSGLSLDTTDSVLKLSKSDDGAQGRVLVLTPQ